MIAMTGMSLTLRDRSVYSEVPSWCEQRRGVGAGEKIKNRAVCADDVASERRLVMFREEGSVVPEVGDEQLNVSLTHSRLGVTVEVKALDRQMPSLEN